MYKKTEDNILDTGSCRSLKETIDCPSGEYITTYNLSTCSRNIDNIQNSINNNTNELESEPKYFKQGSKNTEKANTFLEPES